MKATSGLYFLLFTSLISGQVSGASVPEKPKARPQPSSYWAEVEVGLGSIQPDGTLKLRYPLCKSETLELLGVQCELVHFIETDTYGRPRSAWRIVGLQTSLAPRERGKLLWKPLSAAPVEFDRSNIGRSFKTAGAAQWRIRESRLHEYEIRSLDGHNWRYADGLLKSAAHPALGEFAIETLGAWVRTVRSTGDAFDPTPLLTVTYDIGAKPVSLAVNAGPIETFQWQDQGVLGWWQRAGGGAVTFTYRDGLLEKILEPGRPVRRFAWKTNPHYQRGDSRWTAPVHLASDGENTYIYYLSSKGFVIRRREIANNQETVTISNPLRRRLEQRTAHKALIVTFRAARSPIMALERIEDGSGEILEEYRYNDSGQLVGIRRRGEPERNLSYDETGRLMALTEGKLQ